MSFFGNLREKAGSDPKIVVLAELGADRDSVIKEAIDIIKDNNTAIPIGLTTEMIMESGKLDEFAEYYTSRKNMGLALRKKIVKDPSAFAAMMVRLGYAHGMVSGRYESSSKVMAFISGIIGDDRNGVRSVIFFREPPEKYPVFDLVACADVVVNTDPDPETLLKIIVNSAETYELLAGRKPSIALLSFITGIPSLSQVNDPGIKKNEETLALYRKNGYKWTIYQAQTDSALIPDVAISKKAPFAEKPADLLIGGNLHIANNIYKLLDRLIIGGDSMLFTQGLRLPAMDLSRGDNEQNIANVVAACSVYAQHKEKIGEYGEIDNYFLDFVS